MTNFEYIKNHITELDLAYCQFPYGVGKGYQNRPKLFTDKIYSAYWRWCKSTSSNSGNMAKGVHNGRVIKDNPSIWAFEEWHYPDGSRKKMGRNHIISFQVWLSKQYDPNDWIEGGDYE